MSDENGAPIYGRQQKLDCLTEHLKEQFSWPTINLFTTNTSELSPDPTPRAHSDRIRSIDEHLALEVGKVGRSRRTPNLGAEALVKCHFPAQ